MITTYRTEPLNYENVFHNLINGMRRYFSANHLHTAVLGISGGIDSTVVAALCKAASIPLIGISLPCSSNGDDENEAAIHVGHEFCDVFRVCNLQEEFEHMEHFTHAASGKECTPISQGNIKARLRMITLYDIASKENGLVLDTDNLTEHFLGFYTIHGDSADLTPIGSLWKHEIYELARWMLENVFKDSKALACSLKLVPTDGNGVKAGGDLAQIAPNSTYDEVDSILMGWVGLDNRIKESIIASDFKNLKSLVGKYGHDTVKRVITRSINSDFKRRHAPLIIDYFNGSILSSDGSIVSA